MEQLNKVELRGILGVIRVQNVGEKRLATMSVTTNYCYKGGDGCPVIEMTWHIVTAWEGKGMAVLIFPFSRRETRYM